MEKTEMHIVKRKSQSEKGFQLHDLLKKGKLSRQLKDQ